MNSTRAIREGRCRRCFRPIKLKFRLADGTEVNQYVDANMRVHKPSRAWRRRRMEKS